MPIYFNMINVLHMTHLDRKKDIDMCIYIIYIYIYHTGSKGAPETSRFSEWFSELAYLLI